jgi:hypothetical protein
MAGKEDARGLKREDAYARLLLSVGKLCSKLLILKQGKNKQQVGIFRQENVYNETKITRSK